ncbi:hypothetical protein F441_18106 [Phytophthora nicotianae CJ01A1]|uniref:Uncharacterized protein n=1 Tax=Phytophthora nicotianae CJ01A1 TaxID=1317063 RepID=W2W3X9_PHYNI|nr:hypothetical protein F441_18106 [Phytophthora nicotianae CJ01A1]
MSAHRRSGFSRDTHTDGVIQNVDEELNMCIMDKQETTSDSTKKTKRTARDTSVAKRGEHSADKGGV